MSDEEPVYEPGDVVYGRDPYKGGEAARPWLVISNHAGKPFHGEQYIVLALTTKSWVDGLIEIDEDAWLTGGTPNTSRIAPWSVQSIDADDIGYWQGRVTAALVTDAVDELVATLR